jgi:hypothetical protein
MDLCQSHVFSRGLVKKLKEMPGTNAWSQERQADALSKDGEVRGSVQAEEHGSLPIPMTGLGESLFPEP